MAALDVASRPAVIWQLWASVSSCCVVAIRPEAGRGSCAAEAGGDLPGNIGHGASELLQHGGRNAESRRREQNRRDQNTAMVMDRGRDADLLDGGDS